MRHTCIIAHLHTFYISLYAYIILDDEIFLIIFGQQQQKKRETCKNSSQFHESSTLFFFFYTIIAHEYTRTHLRDAERESPKSPRGTQCRSFALSFSLSHSKLLGTKNTQAASSSSPLGFVPLLSSWYNIKAVRFVLHIHIAHVYIYIVRYNSTLIKLQFVQYCMYTNVYICNIPVRCVYTPIGFCGVFFFFLIEQTKARTVLFFISKTLLLQCCCYTMNCSDIKLKEPQQVLSSAQHPEWERERERARSKQKRCVYNNNALHTVYVYNIYIYIYIYSTFTLLRTTNKLCVRDFIETESRRNKLWATVPSSRFVCSFERL